MMQFATFKDHCDTLILTPKFQEKIKKFKEKCNKIKNIKTNERVLLDHIMSKPLKENPSEEELLYHKRKELTNCRKESQPYMDTTHVIFNAVITELELARQHFNHYIDSKKLEVEKEYNEAYTIAHRIEVDIAELRTHTIAYKNLGFMTLKLTSKDETRLHAELDNAFVTFIKKEFKDDEEKAASGANIFSQYELNNKLKQFLALKIPLPLYLEEILPGQFDPLVWYPKMFEDERKELAENTRLKGAIQEHNAFFKARKAEAAAAAATVAATPEKNPISVTVTPPSQ